MSSRRYAGLQTERPAPIIRLPQRKKQNQWALLLVMLSSLFLLGAGSAVFFLNYPPQNKSTHSQKSQPKLDQRHQSKPPAALAVAAKPIRQREKPQLRRQDEIAKTEPLKPVARQWVEEAREQYLEALRAKERRLSIQARRLGQLNPAQRKLGVTACKLIKENGIKNLPPFYVNAAKAIAPDFVRKMQKDDFARLQISNGEKVDWLPPEQREKLYEKFASHLDIQSKWSLANPFDDLSPMQMEAAISVAVKAELNGLGSLDWSQRQLLLDAGALEYFNRCLDQAE